MASGLSSGGFRGPISRSDDAARLERVVMSSRWGGLLAVRGGGERFLTQAPPAIAQNRDPGLSLSATPRRHSAAQLPPGLLKQCLKRKTFGQRQPDLARGEANAGAQFE